MNTAGYGGPRPRMGGGHRFLAALAQHVAAAAGDMLAQFVDNTERRSARDAVAASEAKFRSLVQRSADIAIVTDEEGVITFASPAVSSVLGYQPEDVLGRSSFDFVHPDDVPALVGVLEQLLAAPGVAQPVLECRVMHRDGTWRWCEDAATNLLDDPAVRGIVANIRDVTSRHVAQDDLAASEERYRTIVETAHEGIAIVGPGGEISFANPRMVQITGRSSEQLCSMSVFDLLVDDEARARYAEHLALRSTGQPEDYEIAFTHPDGELRWLAVAASPLHDRNGAYIGSLGMLSDITERKRFEHELERLARHDFLTGLANRALLEERTTHALARARRTGRAVAVMFVDLDEFKAVNDCLGHATGDELLCVVGGRMRRAVRPTDTVARVGGDEFVILCEDIDDPDDLSSMAQRLLAAIGRPVRLGGTELVPRASIGITVGQGELDELLGRSDAAMYDAKRRGGGYAFYQEQPRSSA